MQKNESERAGKAFCYFFRFLSILNLHINLSFVRLRFEFDIKWLNVCVLKTLNFRLLLFLLFCIKKQINVQKKWKRACMCSLLLDAIVVAVVIVIA